MHDKDCECPGCFAVQAAIIDAGKVVIVEGDDLIVGYMYAVLHANGEHRHWSMHYNTKLEMPHLGYLSVDIQNIVKKESN